MSRALALVKLALVERESGQLPSLGRRLAALARLRSPWQDQPMAVYVDDARISLHGRRWSHLVADSPEELHRAAEQLGLGRGRAQENGRTLHYDLPEHVRVRAIQLGVAQPITWRELVRWRRGELLDISVLRPAQSRSRSRCWRIPRPDA